MNSQSCLLGRVLLLALAAVIAPLGVPAVRAAVVGPTVQVGNQTVNPATLVLVPPDAVPPFGNFYSLHLVGGPPLPGLPPAYAEAGCPVYWLGGNHYLIDDTGPDATALRAQQQLAQAAAAMSAFGSQQLLSDGGLGLMSSSYGPTDLWLELVAVTNQTAVLTIHSPVPDGVYDLFGTTNLSASVPGLNLTNWVWLARTNAGETTLTVPLLSGAEGYYVLGTTNDSDGDGLTDAFERLVEPSRYAAGLAAGGRAGQGHRFGWAQVF